MKKLFIISLISLTLSLQAQQLPLFSQYMYNPFLHNPSMTGFQEKPNVFLVHRQQWKDMPGAPVTNALSLDGKFHGNEKIGLGMYIYQDVTDLIERLGLGGAYSYSFKLSGDHYLLAGLSFGVTDNQIDFSRAVVMDKDDPFLYSDKRRKISLDAAFGLTYWWKDLQVGLSAPQLLGNDVSFISNASNSYYHLSRHYTASAKYSFYISEANLIKGEPSVMFRIVKGAPVQYDINAMASWKDFLFGGFSYRSNYSVGAHIGIKLNHALSAGYYYDYVISDIGSYSGGGHEFMLGYTFGGKKQEEKKPEETTSQQMTDSMLMVLKKENQEQKSEIDNLKKEVEDLKTKSNAPPNNNNNPGGNNNSPDNNNNNPGGNNQGGNNTTNTNNPSTMDTTGMLRKAASAEFKGETGSVIDPGFYVVVGAFKSEDNAIQVKDKWTKVGYQTSRVMFNQKRKLFYVFVLHTPNKDAAVSELGEVRPGATDSWIFEMQ